MNIPLWFREGIAVFVANGGASYTKGSDVYSLMSDEERKAYLSGKAKYWFESDSPADAVTESGVVNLQLYRVGALFVHYLHDMRPEKFDELIQSLLEGEGFDSALKTSYAQNTGELLNSYTKYIKIHHDGS